MMSDFRGGGGGVKKWLKKIGHHLCMIPKLDIRTSPLLVLQQAKTGRWHWRQCSSLAYLKLMAATLNVMYSIWRLRATPRHAMYVGVRPPPPQPPQPPRRRIYWSVMMTQVMHRLHPNFITRHNEAMQGWARCFVMEFSWQLCIKQTF